MVCCCRRRCLDRPWRAARDRRIHEQGSVHASADALLEDVTGKTLKPSIFLRYLTDKYTDLYKL